MEDHQIIHLFMERSEQAICELSDKYGKVCFKIAKNILRNRLDAEECVNDTYLAAWNTIPPENPNPLLTYVCRIVRNLSIKKYHANTARKRNSFYDIALDELENCIPAYKTVEGEYAVQELANAINRFLATLSRENRMMFIRRYWFSDSISEIAGMFRMNKHNVSVRLSRIRGSLKDYLEQEEIWI